MHSRAQITIISAVEGLDRWLNSAQVLLASWWAAWVLFNPPSNFAAFPDSFWFVHELGSERLWAGLIGGGALTHTLGLLFRSWGLREAGRAFGFAGLAVETAFWLIFSLSTLYGNPDTLFGVAGLMIGLGASWRLLRIGLVLPRGW